MALPTCVVFMPISTPREALHLYDGDLLHFAHVFNHLFEPAIRAAGFQALSPTSEGADVIHAEVVRKLETSDLVLCDMSTLNANVFFELGIRTALDLPTVLVRDEKLASVPFDTTLLNHHTYDAALTPWTLPNEVRRLSDHIGKSYVSSTQRNALWKYFGITTRSRLADESTVDEKLSLLIDLVREASRIEVQLPNEAEPRHGVTRLRFESDPDAMTAFLTTLVRLAEASLTVKLRAEPVGPRSARVEVQEGGSRALYLKIYEIAGQHGVDVQIRLYGAPSDVRAADI